MSDLSGRARRGEARPRDYREGVKKIKHSKMVLRKERKIFMKILELRNSHHYPLARLLLVPLAGIMKVWLNGKINCDLDH